LLEEDDPSTQPSRKGLGEQISSRRPIKILVDCGLHQGSHFAERKNWEKFLYDPAEITAVLITHSHIDHIGRLPLLVKNGFQGKIYSTAPTKEASELLLLDSDHILAQTAEQLKMPALFDEEDVRKVMEKWEVIDYHQEFKIPNSKFLIQFYNAGHILGSSFITVEEWVPDQVGDGSKKIRIVFSGDLGNSPAPLLGDKELLPEADYCVMESTYGDRLHEELTKRKEVLEDAIEDTAKQGGVLLIPAFAMERTQELIYELNDLIKNGRIPKMPIFLDSPLAIKLLDVYKKNRNYLIRDVNFNLPGLKMTLTTEESRAITEVKPPKIIIAGSGMSHGGRIVHHEKLYLSDPRNTILIIGYQAAGSLGRRILDGSKTVKIFGEEITVRCRVINIPGYSAHADQEQLFNWVYPKRETLRKIFLVQGEEQASNALGQKIKDEIAVETIIPDQGFVYNL
jgi:metallo-beta-lactamase family protein